MVSKDRKVSMRGGNNISQPPQIGASNTADVETKKMLNGFKKLGVTSSSKNTSMAKTATIYFKLFVYYPIKYLILVLIAFFVYEIWIMMVKYLEKSYKAYKKSFQTLIKCAEGHSSCRLNLIVFNIPDIFKLFVAGLDFFLGCIYLAVAICLFIAIVVCMIPFNMIIPYYNKLIS
jgi:hypothetical protein